MSPKPVTDVGVQGNMGEEVDASLFEMLFHQVLHSSVENKDFLLEQEIILDLYVDGVRYTLTRSGHVSSSHLHLSPREKEIVRLVSKGYPNKAIAAILDISSWTIATHIRRIFAKLGVSTRSEMVAKVLNENLLEFVDQPVAQQMISHELSEKENE